MEEHPNLPKPGYYRHFKGNYYMLLGVAYHSETLEPMIVYRALYGERKLWVRPACMWNETVDRPEYKGPRFVRVCEADVPEDIRLSRNNGVVAADRERGCALFV